MGAGAIGAYVGARLTQAGEDVSFIARGAHLRAMQDRGLTIDSPLGSVDRLKVSATDDLRAVGPVDLVLFAVKMWDTDQAAENLAPLLAPHTRVVTVQNGIDSVADISRHVPHGQVVGGTIYLFAAIAEPGVIRNSGGVHNLIVGAADGDRQIAGLAAALDGGAGLNLALSQDISRDIWQKYIRLVALSGTTALTRRPLGDVLGNEATRGLFRSLLEEVVAVANAEGQDFSGRDVDDALHFFDGLPPAFKASMLQDLERGNRLELHWLSSRVCGLAERHGIDAPANQAVHWGLTLHAAGTG
jgi:2-dehydropantoate 2-reductase